MSDDLASSNSTVEPRYAIRRARNVRIPMPDGVTLAADLFLPDAPGQYPVLLEYNPYRKSDFDWAHYAGHRYFAERGLASMRLDVRGTGDSEGISLDEYSPQEQLDAVAAIVWLAQQPWCNGSVGMWGTSYGGFNSIQVAMHRPPALKAICPMYFSDRRYTDDCHYKGGAMQMLYDMGGYGLSMAGNNLLPPRPDVVGERWMEIWEQRLHNEPWILRWLEHQTEDEQWRQGSLYQDYSAIQCATFMIGGWRDGYTNCNLRTYENLTCPKKLLIGPWLHIRPHVGVPGPAINHWREMYRFFAHWLAGADTGIMDEPPIAIYVQHHDPPHPGRTMTSGLWRYETEWPPARGGQRVHYLGDGALNVDSPAPTSSGDGFDYHPGVGASFGKYPAGGPLMLPGDQRVEEALSVVYTSPVLEEPVEVLGYPQAVLHVESTAEVVTFVVRVCDVAPDGSSALVTKGVLNGTHRESHSDPMPLARGQVYELTVPLDATSWVFKAGHRIRLSVSNADFPNTWPSPQRATSQVRHGGAFPSRLVLPIVGPEIRPLPTPVFEPAPNPSPDADRGSYRVTHDLLKRQIAVSLGGSSISTTRIDKSLVIQHAGEATATVSEDDPARAWVRGEQMKRFVWPERTIELRCKGQIESDATTFYVTIHIDITMNGMPHFSRHWLKSISRRLL